MAGICRTRLAEERKQWRKDHPFVRVFRRFILSETRRSHSDVMFNRDSTPNLLKQRMGV
jgi:hypothetical protein